MKYTEISLSGKGKEKRVYYEWIRLTACFFVIFNHLKGYVLFQNASGAKQLFYMVLSVITKINVPLFFMVSGALLLGKREDIFTVLKKRVSRICLVILLFSLGIYTECRLYALAQGRDYEFTVKRFLYGVFERSLRLLASLCLSWFPFIIASDAENSGTDEPERFLHAVCTAFYNLVDVSHLQSFPTSGRVRKSFSGGGIFCAARHDGGVFLSPYRLLYRP